MQTVHFKKRGILFLNGIRSYMDSDTCHVQANPLQTDSLRQEIPLLLQVNAFKRGGEKPE